MKIADVPFAAVDWSHVAAVDHPGEQGTATWRTIEMGNVRIRKVDYSPGYLADHWCARGHVLLVLEGELVTELRDGRRISCQLLHDMAEQENGIFVADHE